MLGSIAPGTLDLGINGCMVSSAAVVALGAWLAMWPGGWLVARILSSKKQELERTVEHDDEPGVVRKTTRGFPDGGEMIGRLERLLIYIFVLSGDVGAVGFLVAAKSIFRFGELSDHQNRLEAEYITIGTLLSFTTGLVITMGFRSLVLPATCWVTP